MKIPLQNSNHIDMAQIEEQEELPEKSPPVLWMIIAGVLALILLISVIRWVRGL